MEVLVVHQLLIQVILVQIQFFQQSLLLGVEQVVVMITVLEMVVMADRAVGQV